MSSLRGLLSTSLGSSSVSVVLPESGCGWSCGLWMGGVWLLFGAWRLRGQCKIIRNICRCVRLILFCSAVVNVQAELPYSIVGVIVPWNNLNLLFRE